MSDPSMSNLSDLPDAVWLFLAKAVGAIAGSAVSIAYLLPKNSREAYLRFAVGITVGMIFGTSAGWKIAKYLEVHDNISNIEISLSGAAFASLCAWWALGVLSRLARGVGTSGTRRINGDRK